MKYSQYQVDDFLNNESFQSFALNQKKEDSDFWRNWIKNNPNKASEVNEALKILTSFSIKPISSNQRWVDEDWEKLSQVFSGRIEVNKTQAPKPAFFIWKVAASIALLIGIMLAAYQYVNYFESKAEQIVIEKLVPKGQKLTISLPDGSRVKLNGNSHFKYEQNYLLKQRKVSLIGEAYFEVAKDSINPFTVFTGAISTTALGTSFNIRSYENEGQTQVFLLTGKVLVASLQSDNVLILEPGDGALYHKDDAKIITYKFNKDEVLAWKDGIIKFKNAGIDEVMATLERWYGVTIEVHNSPDPTWKITGTFENESLENVMESISYATTLNYKLQNGKLILTF